MKTKTRDLSACLKRRLWIAGVCLAAFSFLSVSVVYAADDIQTIQQQKKGMTIKGKVLGTSLLITFAICSTFYYYAIKTIKNRKSSPC